MALTDQPYYPKYVDDYLTDEKLLMCDSSSEGVYNRILCHMHKSDSYGKLIISDFEKAKFKQKLSKIEAKPELRIINVDTVVFLMYVEKVKSLIGREYDTVYNALFDLIGNGVLRITDGVLWQKRMFEDGQKSISKANNGKKGGEKRKQKLSKIEAKPEQNTVTVTVNEDVNDIEVKDEIIVEPKLKFPFDSKKFISQWDLWKVFRRKNDKFRFLNIDSENRKLKELENLSNGNEKTAIAIIQQSIDNGWKGFFELKNKKQEPSKFVSNR